MSAQPDIDSEDSQLGDVQLAYDIVGAAKQLNVSRSTVCRLITAGKLTSIKIMGRRLVPRSELERYVADRLAAARSEAL